MAITAAVIAALGIGTAIYGGVQASKARKAAAENARNRPVYTMPQSEWDTLSLLENRAGQGLSDDSKRLYGQSLDRGLNSGLDAILKGGGNVNNVANLFDNYASASNALAVRDDEARLRNLNALIAQRQRMAEYADKDYAINRREPWMDRAQALAQEQAQGQQTMWSGINTAASGVTSYTSGLGRQRQMNNDTGLRTGNGQTPTYDISGYGNNSMSVGNNYYRNNPSPFTSTPMNTYGVDVSKLSPEQYQTYLSLMQM